MIKTGEAAKKYIQSLKQEYISLLQNGPEVGTLAYGVQVNRLKARILASMEEYKYFGSVTVVY